VFSQRYNSLALAVRDQLIRRPLYGAISMIDLAIGHASCSSQDSEAVIWSRVVSSQAAIDL